MAPTIKQASAGVLQIAGVFGWALFLLAALASFVPESEKSYYETVRPDRFFFYTAFVFGLSPVLLPRRGSGSNWYFTCLTLINIGGSIALESYCSQVNGANSLFLSDTLVWSAILVAILIWVRFSFREKPKVSKATDFVIPGMLMFMMLFAWVLPWFKYWSSIGSPVFSIGTIVGFHLFVAMYVLIWNSITGPQLQNETAYTPSPEEHS